MQKAARVGNVGILKRMQEFPWQRVGRSCWEAYLQIEGAEYMRDWLSIPSILKYLKDGRRRGQFINHRQSKSHLLN